jgi:hypothetical protein
LRGPKDKSLSLWYRHLSLSLSHTHTHARTHARTNTHTHTHTHTPTKPAHAQRMQTHDILSVSQVKPYSRYLQSFFFLRVPRPEVHARSHKQTHAVKCDIRRIRTLLRGRGHAHGHGRRHAEESPAHFRFSSLRCSLYHINFSYCSLLFRAVVRALMCYYSLEMSCYSP